MRTTVSLDRDTEAAVRDLRAAEHLGLSEAVNELIRRGMTIRTKPDTVFRSPKFKMHAKLDYTNTGEVLDMLDRP